MISRHRIEYFFQEQNGKYIFLLFCILGLSYLYGYPQNSEGIGHIGVNEHKYPSITSNIDLYGPAITKQRALKKKPKSTDRPETQPEVQLDQKTTTKPTISATELKKTKSILQTSVEIKTTSVTTTASVTFKQSTTSTTLNTTRAILSATKAEANEISSTKMIMSSQTSTSQAELKPVSTPNPSTSTQEYTTKPFKYSSIREQKIKSCTIPSFIIIGVHKCGTGNSFYQKI